MTKAIQYLERNKINVSKWEECIAKAPNGLIYGHSWWLDHMASHWDALVLNDYDAVMPLVWKRKYGCYYLYQPFFTASLGVFARENKSIDLTGFLQEIPSKFKLWDIDVNETNTLPEHSQLMGLSTRKRKNALLDISKNYAQLKEQYSRLASRSIAKARHNNIVITRNAAPEEIVSAYKKEYQSEHTNITGNDYGSLIACCDIAAKEECLSGYLARTPAGETIAFYLVLHDHKFVYSLLGGSTAKGKSMGAFYLLTDAAIQDQAGYGKVFRFEGSDIKGISFFNSQFKPTPVDYLHVKMNRLPFPANIFKK